MPVRLAALVLPALLSDLALATVSAQERALPSQFLSVGYAGQVIGSLLLVVGCLVGLLLLLRRLQNTSARGASAVLRVVSSVSVGPRERVVLVQAGSQQILLGVAPGAVRTLQVFPEPIVTAPALSDGASVTDFAAVLGRLKRGEVRRS